tara:strand:+ start:8031 stop:9164 length:1134 start_codon:yes stop_codon:yes gene_type:complete
MAYIRPVRVDEVEAVNDFLSKNGLIMPAPGAAAARFWEGRWVRNPTLSQHDPSVVHGWVLEDAGRMVGFFGNLPMAGVFGAEPVRIACASAWAVEPAYRDWVEKLCDCYFHQPNIDLLLVTSAIKPTARRFAQFDGCAVPQPDLGEILYWVVEAQGFLRAAFRKKGRGGGMAWLLGLLGSVPLDFSVRLKGRRPYGSLDNLSLVSLSGIDAAFDDLWARRRVQLPTTLLANRDAATLRWHFGLGGTHDQTRVLRYDEDGVLKGYVVLVREDAPDIGLKRLKIADMFVDSDDAHVAQALFAGAYDFATLKKCHVLEVVGLAVPLRAQALKSKPMTRAMATFPFYYKVPPGAAIESLGTELMQPDAWYMTAYDGDTVLL